VRCGVNACAVRCVRVCVCVCVKGGGSPVPRPARDFPAPRGAPSKQQPSRTPGYWHLQRTAPRWAEPDSGVGAAVHDSKPPTRARASHRRSATTPHERGPTHIHQSDVGLLRGLGWHVTQLLPRIPLGFPLHMPQPPRRTEHTRQIGIVGCQQRGLAVHACAVELRRVGWARGACACGHVQAVQGKESRRDEEGALPAAATPSPATNHKCSGHCNSASADASGVRCSHVAVMRCRV
jgi:hypothetical protein